jgi:NADPH-dependent curcumin reductase CurA
MVRDNLSFHLAERPTDEIIVGKTFEQRTTPAPTADSLKDGQVLVEVLYLSLDPAMRTYLNDARSYMPPVPIGGLMRGITVSRVLASKNPKAPVGEFVVGPTGWTEIAVLSEGTFEPASNFPGIQAPQDMLSALGLTGMTAWLGMTLIGEPKAGETVVVSGAAGATGSVAGQIAKIKGARVVGIAGSDDKCKWLVDELGFDVALNYKDADFKKKFKEATPNFVDVYFDNVGGEILDMNLARAKEFSRFVMCGGISQYNTADRKGPVHITNVIVMRIKMQGFIVTDHTDKWAQARGEISKWVEEGKIKKTETIVKGGLRAAESSLIDLYKGVNTGKLIIEVRHPDETPSKL